MNPIVIDWPASTTNTIVNANIIQNGLPLTFVTKTYIPDSSVSVQGNVPGNLVPPYGDSPRYSLIPNTGTGANKVSFSMPIGNVRNIAISAAVGSVNLVPFVVVGLDQNNNQITETIIGTAGTAHGLLFYSTLLSITPTSTPVGTNTVNVGLGDSGATELIQLDVWNKQNNYTIAYSKVVGTVDLVPIYTINPVYEFINGVQTRIATPEEDTSLYFELPLNNPNIIASPAAASTSPVTTVAAFSVVGIPMTGLFTAVEGTSGSFTQTILQQGGLV